MGAEDAEAIIDQTSLREELCVACVNSPESVTISESLKDIDKLMNELESQSVFARKLATGGRAYQLVP
jgi:acyl transferase domain-containing protein